MVTDILVPTTYHIGKERNICERVIEEERSVLIKMMMIRTAAFLSKLFLGTLMVLTM